MIHSRNPEDFFFFNEGSSVRCRPYGETDAGDLHYFFFKLNEPRSAAPPPVCNLEIYLRLPSSPRHGACCGAQLHHLVAPSDQQSPLCSLSVLEWPSLPPLSSTHRKQTIRRGQLISPVLFHFSIAGRDQLCHTFFGDLRYHPKVGLLGAHLAMQRIQWQ